MISQEVIEQIKDKSNIVDVIEQFVKIKKQGSEYVGLCPFHDERTPSFKVHPGKRFFKCFGCGRGGDVIEFLMLKKNISYIESIKWLSNLYNIKLEESYHKKTVTKPIPRLEKLSKKFIEWFEEKRKISNYTLLKLKITEAKEWMPKAGQETDALCFNYFRDEQLVNIKFRSANKDFKLAKDAEIIFYNLDSIKDVDECCITEGEIDCATLLECGVNECVSVPNGTPDKGELSLEYLDNCWQYFAEKKKIILFTDKDLPGFKLRSELSRRLGIERCYKVSYPDDCKDINDVLVKHGKQAVLDCYENAEEFPIEGIINAADVADEILEYYDNGFPNGYAVPVDGLRENLQLMLGQFTTITGIPGHGKSEFVDKVMIEMSRSYEWSWGVISFENQPVSIHIAKLIQKFEGKSFVHRKNIDSRIRRNRLADAVYFIHNYFHFINIDETDVTLDGILLKARELVQRKGIRGLLIDPWNRIEHKARKGQDKLDYIASSLAAISKFCKRNLVHVILVAHPFKQLKNKDGKYDIPTMYSVSGSADFYNMTDNGLCVYSDGNIVDVYRQKIRYEWLGEKGFSTYRFDEETRQYLFMSNTNANDKDRLKFSEKEKIAVVPYVPEDNSYNEPNPF